MKFAPWLLEHGSVGASTASPPSPSRYPGDAGPRFPLLAAAGIGRNVRRGPRVPGGKEPRADTGAAIMAA